MTAAYCKPHFTLSSGNAADTNAVRALQRDLRALGYLHGGIDGDYGGQTASAVRALQFDLLNNKGTGKDGPAPVALVAFNDDGAGNRLVAAVTGVLDQGLAQCMVRLLDDPRVAKLPRADNPAAENKKALDEIAAIDSTIAPTPFIAAMVRQESGGCHYREPGKNDEDSFVTVGLDRDKDLADRITSRGYGIGQYTIFHHPPRGDEVSDFIADPVRNVQRAFTELREKFDRYIAGPADRADDRTAEHPLLRLRLCKYAPSEPRYMRDCKACAASLRKVDIVQGVPVHEGASLSYQPTQYYKSVGYMGVPARADFPCDWPYAVRRYNGSGVNSYHYQARILLNLLR